jgi:hypothetical protein
LFPFLTTTLLSRKVHKINSSHKGIYDHIFHQFEIKISETMRPYNANASPKIRIRMSPTNNLSCSALDLMPVSPTIPIAYPAAYINHKSTTQLKPQTNPDAI